MRAWGQSSKGAQTLASIRADAVNKVARPTTHESAQHLPAVAVEEIRRRRFTSFKRSCRPKLAPKPFLLTTGPTPRQKRDASALNGGEDDMEDEGAPTDRPMRDSNQRGDGRESA